MFGEKEVVVVMVAFALTLAAFGGVLYNFLGTSVGGERVFDVLETRVELDGLRKVYVLRFNRDISFEELSVSLSYRRGEKVFSLFDNCSVGGKYFLYFFDGVSSTVCVGYNVIVKYVPDYGLSITFEVGGKNVEFVGKDRPYLSSFGKDIYLEKEEYSICDLVYVIYGANRLYVGGNVVDLKCFLQNCIREPLPLISVPLNNVLGAKILAKSVVEIVIFGNEAANTITYLKIGGNRVSLGQ
ncbi:MAG: hypothetical protein N3F64_03710 [Nitrososphaeria archaeon]|nr:hypothetical protein [Nitrososphaeria archaeon]